MTGPHRTIIWRCLFQPGMEHFTLREVEDGWSLAGTVVAVVDEKPLRVSYAIACASVWHTRRVDVSIEHGGAERRLELVATGDGGWQADGQPLDSVAGCVDVDLGITPATNTLPIRRLNLEVGAGADVVASWVRFPALTIQPLSQRYTRVAERRYRYESDTGFECELDVDADGIVTNYPGGWEKIG